MSLRLRVNISKEERLGEVICNLYYGEGSYGSGFGPDDPVDLSFSFGRNESVIRVVTHGNISLLGGWSNRVVVNVPAFSGIREGVIWYDDLALSGPCVFYFPLYRKEVKINSGGHVRFLISHEGRDIRVSGGSDYDVKLYLPEDYDDLPGADGLLYRLSSLNVDLMTLAGDPFGESERIVADSEIPYFIPNNPSYPFYRLGYNISSWAFYSYANYPNVSFNGYKIGYVNYPHVNTKEIAVLMRIFPRVPQGPGLLTEINQYFYRVMRNISYNGTTKRVGALNWVFGTYKQYIRWYLFPSNLSDGINATSFKTNGFSINGYEPIDYSRAVESGKKFKEIDRYNGATKDIVIDQPVDNMYDQWFVLNIYDPYSGGFFAGQNPTGFGVFLNLGFATEMKEVLFFNRQLTEEERRGLSKRLASQHNISLVKYEPMVVT